MNQPEDSSPQEPQRREQKVSRTLVIGFVVIALLLGFSLGLYSSDSIDRVTGTSPVLYDEELITSLFEQASSGVVEIVITRPTGNSQFPRTGTGSGFFIDHSGHIVTNNHVVSGAESIVVKLADGRSLDAKVLGRSAADDLALIQVEAKELGEAQPLTLADSDSVAPGQMAVAIGSPFRNFNSITVGIVSGTGRGPVSSLQRPIPDMIQTDAPLNSGNSGGPLLNSDGEVIGVTSSVRTGSAFGLDEYRIGFAVPSNTVRDLMPELLVAREIKRPWLGIRGGPIFQDLSDFLGIEDGVVISSVFPGSPAEQAGLNSFRNLTNYGDVIIGINGLPVSTMEDMVGCFNSVKPGDTVTLSVLRDRNTIEIEVTLAAWPDT